MLARPIFFLSCDSKFPSSATPFRLTTSGFLAVGASAAKLEATQPEAFAELYKGYSMKYLDVKANGAVHGFGRLTHDPNAAQGLTYGAATEALTYGGSPAALDVIYEDVMAVATCWGVRELPEAFFDLMAADLSGPLAEEYRGYIRCRGQLR